jgi:hypothetical protein
MLNLQKGDIGGMNRYRDYVKRVCRDRSFYLDEPYSSYDRIHLDKLARIVAKDCEQKFGDEVADRTFSYDLAAALIHRICLDTTRDGNATARRREARRRLQEEVRIYPSH